jgi:acetyltransferase-like isoleucine patch superfamily enzyme
VRRLVALLSLLLPWPLRRAVLRSYFHYEVADSARIGFSFLYPRRLVLGENARIGSLTVCKDIDLLELGESAIIGNLNWITGYPSGTPGHFEHQLGRRPELVLDPHAALTNRHLIDCTDRIRIGAFTTVAGFATQLLTHSINLEENRQEAHPITIGTYCFIGTNCVLLGGSRLPDYSVLGAKSLLNKEYTESCYLYGGVPAKPVKELDVTTKYFQRKTGYVN